MNLAKFCGKEEFKQQKKPTQKLVKVFDPSITVQLLFGISYRDYRDLPSTNEICFSAINALNSSLTSFSPFIYVSG